MIYKSLYNRHILSHLPLVSQCRAIAFLEQQRFLIITQCKTPPKVQRLQQSVLLVMQPLLRKFPLHTGLEHRNHSIGRLHVQAQLVDHQLIGGAVGKQLIPTATMAMKGARDPLLCAHGIQADLLGRRRLDLREKEEAEDGS